MTITVYTQHVSATFLLELERLAGVREPIKWPMSFRFNVYQDNVNFLGDDCTLMTLKMGKIPFFGMVSEYFMTKSRLPRPNVMSTRDISANVRADLRESADVFVNWPEDEYALFYVYIKDDCIVFREHGKDLFMFVSTDIPFIGLVKERLNLT